MQGFTLAELLAVIGLLLLLLALAVGKFHKYGLQLKDTLDGPWLEPYETGLAIASMTKGRYPCICSGLSQYVRGDWRNPYGDPLYYLTSPAGDWYVLVSVPFSKLGGYTTWRLVCGGVTQGMFKQTAAPGKPVFIITPTFTSASIEQGCQVLRWDGSPFPEAQVVAGVVI